MLKAHILACCVLGGGVWSCAGSLTNAGGLNGWNPARTPRSPAPIPAALFLALQRTPLPTRSPRSSNVARLRAPVLYWLLLSLLHVSKLFCVRIPPHFGAVNTRFARGMRTADVWLIGAGARTRDAPRKTGHAAALHHPESQQRWLHDDAARGWHSDRALEASERGRASGSHAGVRPTPPDARNFRSCG